MTLRLRWPSHRRGAPRVAVMGALRSGTNLVAGLLETHWHLTADFHAFGWKHAGVPILGPSSELSYPDLPIVWVCKDPHALVASLHRYRLSSPTGRWISLDGAAEFRAFLRSPITIWDSQLKGSPRLRFANPVQYWNFVTWNFETLHAQRFRAMGVNYESLLADPEILAGIAEITRAFRRETGPIKMPSSRMGRGKSRAKDGAEIFDAEGYRARDYLAQFEPDDLAFVAAEVDPWLMKRRGYVLP